MLLYRFLPGCLASLICTGAIYAGGFQVNENSPYLQGMASAGAAASPDDVTSIFVNPANLGFIQQSVVYVGGSYIMPNIKMNNAQATHGVHYSSIPFEEDPVSGSSAQDNIAKSALAPSFYGAWRINDQFAAGIAVTSPWGITTQYDNDSVVRYAAQETSLKTVNITPELAFNITPKISIAAGVQVQYASAEFSNYDGEVSNPTTQPTDLHANGWGVGAVLGVMVHPFDQTYLGLSYRSPIQMNLSGSGNQWLLPQGSTPINPNMPYNSYISDATTSLKTPGVINLGVTQFLTKKWQLRGEVQYTMWNSLDSITINMPGAYSTSSTINLDWRNSWLLALGTDYALTNRWSIRTGVAFDQTPTVSQTRDARTPDNNRYWLTFGTSYKITDSLRIDAVYEHVFIPDQNINVTEYSGQNANVSPIEKNTVVANYSGSVDILGLGIQYQF